MGFRRLSQWRIRPSLTSSRAANFRRLSPEAARDELSCSAVIDATAVFSPAPGYSPATVRPGRPSGDRSTGLIWI
jgi:hypothetical protein